MKKTKIGVLMTVLMVFGLMVTVPAILRADDSMMMKKDDARIVTKPARKENKSNIVILKTFQIKIRKGSSPTQAAP